MERSLDAWQRLFRFPFLGKRVAEATPLGYGQDISSFVQFLKEKGNSSQSNSLVLEEFVSQESERAGSYFFSSKISVYTFFFLVREKEVPENLARLIHPLERNLPRFEPGKVEALARLVIKPNPGV